jgi:hypothetical protein
VALQKTARFSLSARYNMRPSHTINEGYDNLRQLWHTQE